MPVGRSLVPVAICVTVLVAVAAPARAADPLSVPVLVDSRNAAGYSTAAGAPGEYQRTTERYLEHLEVPYVLYDVATAAPPADLAARPAIIVAHRGVALSPAWDAAITSAVAGGTGLLLLDWDPQIGAKPYVRTIFGATGSTVGASDTKIRVLASALPGGAQPHYIAGFQRRYGQYYSDDNIWYFHADASGTLRGAAATVLEGASGQAIATIGGSPLFLATSYGRGRAVFVGTLDYLRADRFGFLQGIDDLFWRSLVWVARKPFVLRGYPRFFAVQMDDTRTGFGSRIVDFSDPTLTPEPWPVTAFVYLSSLPSGSSDRATVIRLINEGKLRVSPHSYYSTKYGDLFWNGSAGEHTDDTWLTALEKIQTWREGAGGADRIPALSHSMVGHYWDLSRNIGDDVWTQLGVRYVTDIQNPGYQNNDDVSINAGRERVVLGPFRTYELPPKTTRDEDFSFFFRGDKSIGSRAGLAPRTFFWFVTQMIDYGRWSAPDYVWPSATRMSAERSYDQFRFTTWRFWSALAPVQLYTHDGTNLELSTTSERRDAIRNNTQHLLASGARMIFIDDLGAYICARTHSRLVDAQRDGANLILTYTGSALDMDGRPIATEDYVFLGDDDGATVSVPGFSGGGTFTVPIPTEAPRIDAVDPSSGLTAGGAQVAIYGANFTGVTGVTFGGAAATVLSSSTAYRLDVVVPAHAAGTVDVAVAASGGTARLAGGFTYLSGPRIDAISPSAGPATGGTAIEIDGAGFEAGASVTVGGRAAGAVSVVSSVRITAVTPAGTPGAADIVVATAHGSARLAGGFTYIGAGGGGGTGGGTVVFADDFSDGDASGWTISPLGHASGWSVVSGQYAYDGSGHTQAVSGDPTWTDYTLSATITLSQLANYPGGIRGRVDPSTGAAYALWLYPGSGALRLYRASAWNIDAPGLTLLGSVSGIPFDLLPHRYSLTFSGTSIQAARDGTVLIQASDAALARGAIALDVSNRPVRFDDVTVTLPGAPPPPPPPPAPAPTIAAVSPNAGSAAGGTRIAVSGTGYTTGTTVAVGGIAATDVLVTDTTRVEATTPRHAAGPADVVVSNANGSATAPAAFTFVDPALTGTASVLLADDFGDGDFAGWTISPLGLAAGFSVSGAALRYDGRGDTNLWRGDAGWTDYGVEAFVRTSAADGFPGGVRVRVDPASGAGYAVWIYPAEGTIRLLRAAGWRIDASGTIELARASGLSIGTAAHALRIECQSSAIRVRWDGQLVIDASDGGFASGAVSLDVSNREMFFDDLAVYTGTAALPPALDAVSPASGPSGGGTALVLLGRRFPSNVSVLVGGAPASGVARLSDTQIQATAPAHAAGTVAVAVSASTGSSTLAGAFTYVSPPAFNGFSDDFASGDFAGWTISPLGHLAGFSVTNGELRYDGGGHTQLVRGDSTWTDYKVECRYRLTSASNYPGGLRGRVDPSTGASYGVWVYPGYNQLRLYRIVAWNIDTPGLSELARVSIPLDTSPHRLGLAFQGTTIRVLWDGAAIASATDATWTKGAVALDVSNREVFYDDVTVGAVP
jgi:hypothetical protein